MSHHYNFKDLAETAEWEMQKGIGTPRQSVEWWLERFARDNDDAAERAFAWNRAKYRGQAWAFRTAAEMVRRGQGIRPLNLTRDEEVERLRNVIERARLAIIGDKDDTPTDGIAERCGRCYVILRENS